MTTNRVPSLGGDDRLADKFLPARLTDANLTSKISSEVAADVPDSSSAIGSALADSYAGLGAAVNNFTGKVELDGGFTNSYDSALWIAPAIRTNPTNNSQGLYIQHRVSGDLGGLVHDAGASELQLNAATNTGSGQSAHENSLVMTGGANTVNKLTGVLANFHTTGSPTGTVSDIALFRGTQAPALPVDLTVDRFYGLYLDPQTIGAENYSIWAPDADSVISHIRPKDASTIGLLLKGRSSQTADLLRGNRSDDVTLFRVLADGSGGVGSTPSQAASWYVNNDHTGADRVGLIVKANSAQSVDLLRVTSSADALYFAISPTGLIKAINQSILIRNSDDTGTLFSLTTAGPRWDDATLQQTTVGAAGAASAPPASPTKYLKVVDSAGTALVIPAYAAS